MEQIADPVLSEEDFRAVEVIAERFQSTNLSAAERARLLDELETIAERYAGDRRFFE